MATGTTKRISAASARAHTRRSNPATPSRISGIVKKVLLVFVVGLLAWGYQTALPPPHKTCGSKDGPPITGPRIQLKDGRHLAYREFGVPRENAKHKIVFIHGFDSCRHDALCLTGNLPEEFIQSHGLYILSFDRPGYGESDPNPKLSIKSTALDIEELADQLGLGSKFYIIGFSMGGQVAWTCLKYIPHRLAGIALLAPVVNYWWPSLPSNLTGEVYKKLLPQDQWALSVAHHMPWLVYWWNTQKLFPPLSLVALRPELLPKVFSPHDLEVMASRASHRHLFQGHIRQQGEYNSIHRDLAVHFGTWEFDPMELKNPFPENEGPKAHLWQGDEDLLVPVILQRHIVSQLPWIQYHELTGRGHSFPCFGKMPENIIQSLITPKSH
ncbi:uncharacterized protein LOC127239688 [Andrographis paniculata]|uniref:uncharacterized protein LOC127239688 n=1 Tax=Andrographis paniculata TaxID=175694 RepID=UPI0021E7CB42|nr:uncharacterized protein LOC127239688 [Andrographis paniculata]